MLQSQLFAKTKKEHIAEAETISHQLLLRGDFINQELSGVYSFLPLGWRVHRKIENIIRQELNKINAQEISMSVLQPRNLWQETGRWDTIDPPLFKFKDRHHKELALGPTHEEMITDLVRKRLRSYQDFPLYLYQIQDKFRNEMRATNGLLRTREFFMMDLYSFHTTKADLNDYYKKVIGAYQNICQRCGLEFVMTEASSGTIGGSESCEFMAIADSGEDRILVCEKCQLAMNTELGEAKTCKHCDAKLTEKRSIEIGHVFKLGTKYSTVMNAIFADEKGEAQLIETGCYGIGLGRLMATVVEASHDDRGIIWPKEIAPFDAHLLALFGKNSDSLDIKQKCDTVYQELQEAGIDVLYDDRQNISAGAKFAEADLIGIPVRLVVSEKTGDRIEFKKRDQQKTELITINELMKKF